MVKLHFLRCLWPATISQHVVSLYMWAQTPGAMMAAPSPSQPPLAEVPDGRRLPDPGTKDSTLRQLSRPRPAFTKGPVSLATPGSGGLSEPRPLTWPSLARTYISHLQHYLGPGTSLDLPSLVVRGTPPSSALFAIKKPVRQFFGCPGLLLL